MVIFRIYYIFLLSLGIGLINANSIWANHGTPSSASGQATTCAQKIADATVSINGQTGIVVKVPYTAAWGIGEDTYILTNAGNLDYVTNSFGSTSAEIPSVVKNGKTVATVRTDSGSARFHADPVTAAKYAKIARGDKVWFGPGGLQAALVKVNNVNSSITPIGIDVQSKGSCAKKVANTAGVNLGTLKNNHLLP